jgi:hypothetical protein
MSILTMDDSALSANILVTESSSTLRVNENGGVYHLGATFGAVEKHRIGALYKRLQREHGTVSSRFLAKQAVLAWLAESIFLQSKLQKR